MTGQTSRTALITGASRGLCLALAKALAQTNWSLTITARGAKALREAEKELSHSTEIRALMGDVADPEHRSKLAEAATLAGGLDAVVNNAGILGPNPQLRSVDGLSTGLHGPQTTHLAMLLALAGPDHVCRTYSQALETGYLWHEFGDLHLILPG